MPIRATKPLGQEDLALTGSEGHRAGLYCTSAYKMTQCTRTGLGDGTAPWITCQGDTNSFGLPREAAFSPPKQYFPGVGKFSACLVVQYPRPATVAICRVTGYHQKKCVSVGNP